MRFIIGVLLLIGTGLGHTATLVPKLTNDGAFVWRCYEGTTISTATTYTSLEAAIPACIDRAQNKPSATFRLQGPTYSLKANTVAVNCVGTWSVWTRVPGSETPYVNGVRNYTETRSYSVTTVPANGGTACPVSPETRVSTETEPVVPPSGLPLLATTGPVLSIAPNNTYFRRNGQPFYWVADTSWLMGWSMTTSEITQYFEDRASKGIKVIQGPIIGLNLAQEPFTGQTDDPFIDSVPMRLNESWWVKTDHAVKEAGRLGMTIAVAPVWGSDNDRIFPSAARHVEFVTLLAKRYSNQAHVLWIAAGEYDKITDNVYVTNNVALNADQLARYNAITTAIRANAHPASLIVYHPDGWTQSSIDFGWDSRVQFNMLQSSSSVSENIRTIPKERDSVLKKPVVESELGYENATNNPWKQRVPAYHTIMQGGAGFTYGNDLIWRAAPGWQTEMQAEGGIDVMTHYRVFAEAIHAEGNTPAQSWVVTPGNNGDGYNSYATALRSGDSKKLYAYVSNGRAFNLNTQGMATGTITAKWYDPRNGVYTAPFSVTRGNNVAFDPPGAEATNSNDWALVVESISQVASDQPLPATTGPVISVAPGGRYFRRDGQPFYWVADTGWYIARDQMATTQITQYLEDRKAKGILVIQGPIFGPYVAPYDGGVEDPFIDGNPIRLNNSWWVKVDHAVKEAGRLGMTIVPALIWGPDSDRVLVDHAKHAEYAALAAKRYGNQAHVMWIPSGEFHKIRYNFLPDGTRAPGPDDPFDLNPDEIARFNLVTTAIRANAHPSSLIVYHPNYWQQPSRYFGSDTRVAFNMLQSSGSIPENIIRIPLERASILTKPVVESEVGYESTTDNPPWKQRVQAYHTFMQGGAGFTYGNDLIWKFATGWEAAMEAEGGIDVMTHYRNFTQSVHSETNVPAQSWVVGAGNFGQVNNSFASALRSGDSKKLYAFVFNGRTFGLNLQGMAAGNLVAKWYDTRNGTYSAPFNVTRGSNVSFDPPGIETVDGNDWALVVESTGTIAGLNITVKRVIMPMENEDSTSIRNPLIVEYINQNSEIKTASYNSTTETASFIEPVLGTYSLRVKDSEGEFSTWVPVASQFITVN